jgi:hypothetical protein
MCFVVVVMAVVVPAVVVPMAMTMPMVMVAVYGPPPGIKHGQPDAKDKDGCNEPKIGVQLLVCETCRRELRDYRKHDDAEGVGDGYYDAEEYRLVRPPLGAYEVCGDDCFSVPGLKCVECAQDKRGYIKPGKSASLQPREDIRKARVH